MTVSEYANIEERFKNDTLGKTIDYDGEYGGQCWDSAEYYFVNYLELPASILAGCGYIANMLYPPKINELLEYFDEVDVHQMIKGDVMIWDRGEVAPNGHIAVYDHFDNNCWFVTQNAPVPNVTTLSVIQVDAGARAFRLKGVVPDPQPEPSDDLVKETTNNLIEVIRRTINGDYGNGDERKEALGQLWEIIQYQVDQNFENGTTDDIRLY